jgi:hypothetical protein
MNYSQRHTNDPPLVALHQNTKSRPIAPLRAFNQIELVVIRLSRPSQSE